MIDSGADDRVGMVVMAFEEFSRTYDHLATSPVLDAPNALQ